MASTLTAGTWDPLQYCTPDELSRIDERFNSALRDVTCLVFWTGVSPERARRWAEQHGLPTLTLAMGPLFSDRDPHSPRYGKSAKAWSRYMKAASGRFAEYACRSGRRAVVLTNPPPHIYSTRKQSNYRNLEEPILKGAVDGASTACIEYAHPMVLLGADFRYQTWPVDESSTWYTFFTTILAKGHGARECASMEIRVVVEVAQKRATAGQSLNSTHWQKKIAQNYAQRAPIEPQEKREDMGRHAELQQQVRYVKRETKRQKMELERRIAEEKRMAKQSRVEQERRIAQEKKETKRKRVEQERRMAQEKKDTKRKRVELEQKTAQEKKDTKRKRVELEQQIAQEKRKTKQKRAEREQLMAQEKKEVRRKRLELKQCVAQEKKETKRKRLELEQQVVREKKEAKRKCVRLEQRIAQEKKEAKQKQAELK